MDGRRLMRYHPSQKGVHGGLAPELITPEDGSGQGSREDGE